MASNNTRSDGGTTATRRASGSDPVEMLNATERARVAVEEFVATCVGESRYATGSAIVKQVDVDVRSQKVSHVVGQKISGDAPDDFLENVRVSRWSDGSPVTWYFERVAGEPAPERLVDRKRKIDIVLEISEAVGAEGAETYTGSRQDQREYTKISLPCCWMYDVLAAVFAKTGYDPELGDEDDNRELREQLGDLGRAECSGVLERAVEDVTITGDNTHWNKETCAVIHELLVDDGGNDGD